MKGETATVQKESAKKPGGFKKAFFGKAGQAIFLVLAGIVIGLGGGYLRWGRQMPAHTTTTHSDSAARQNAEMRSANRLPKQFERAKNQVANALKRGMLTQQQADTINTKLDELKLEIKKIDQNTPEGRDKLRNQREEIRDWAKQNNIPLRYLMLDV